MGAINKQKSNAHCGSHTGYLASAHGGTA